MVCITPLPLVFLLVSWLFLAIPVPLLKFSIFIYLVCTLFIILDRFLLLIMKIVVNSVNFAFCIVILSTFQYTHETDQIAMCI